MPYIETVVDRPDEKVFSPFPGIGADSDFRFVHWRAGLSEAEECISVWTLKGQRIRLTIAQAGWLLAVARNIPGRGMVPVAQVAAQRIAGLDCRVMAEGPRYTIEVPGNPTLTVSGPGYYMLCEALMLSIDADTAVNAKGRAPGLSSPA